MADTEQNRREFLKIMGCGLVAAAAPTALVAQRTMAAELKAGGFSVPYELARFRVQNRFDNYGRTLRTVSFTVQTAGKISGDDMREWFKNNPLEQNVKPPPGFRLISNEFEVDVTGRELSAVLQMVECSPGEIGRTPPAQLIP